MMEDGTMNSLPALLRLPDELLEAIITWLPPDATLAFGTTCRQVNKITYEPLVWRRHCVQTWRYWDRRHELQEKLDLPPARTKWRQLYNERKKADDIALGKFNQLLLTQLNRIHTMEEIAKIGYDAKDLLLKLKNETPDSALDVLARRHYANAILGQVHRSTALDTWDRLSRRQMVRAEEALGAFDLFVLAGEKGDVDDIRTELDRIAQAIKDRDPEFESLSVRKAAIQVARYLRAEGLVGNPDEQDYHALRNNFIGLALFDEVHSSLPLQSVAIYCAVARRLGINAGASNYPSHVHAVITAPPDRSLDGRVYASPDRDAEPEIMHMDPWRTSDEVPQDQLRDRLSQMGIPSGAHHQHLGATSTLEMALRTGRNIMTSVQETRGGLRNAPTLRSCPDVEAAWYAVLWSMIVLGDTSAAALQHRRLQGVPYLLEHLKAHYPEDIGLFETHVPPMFEGVHEQRILLDIIEQARCHDRTRRAPSPRGPSTAGVTFRVGTPVRHRRYTYHGIIIGWDKRCSADPEWVQQMRVDELPQGREQPFYHVIAEDKSHRYVAEVNVVQLYEQPSAAVMRLAGHYFNRWDGAASLFVSNVKEEYPDD